jgi:protein phosphatase
MIKVTIGSASHPGKRKKENEDYHAYFPPEEGCKNKKGILIALADGMGGRSGGAIASKIAIEALMEAYYKDYFTSIPESLEKAFLSANEEVIARGQKDIDLEGMATTLTAVVLKNGKMFYAHVGDSRGYTVYGKNITHFTEDHSYVASLVKAGAISEEEALTHPQANIITRAIGVHFDLTIDVSKVHQQLKENQYIMLCSDGLYKEVSDKEILNTIFKYQEPDVVCKKLVEKANQYGGSDNITVLVAKINKSNFMSSILSGF